MIAFDTNLEIRLASDTRDNRAACRLRYQVFVEELGGDGHLVDHVNRLESDRFDPYAQQLILVDNRRDVDNLDHVVGVYRMLDGEGAKRAGQFYSDTEYDLTVLKDSGRRLLELGRSCLHPDYRKGTALFMLWNGLSEYIRRHDIEVLFGVASFFGTDASVYATHLSYLAQNHMTPPELLVTARPKSYLPMDPVPADAVSRAVVMPTMPPLIKAYLRIGGFVGDGAYVDKTFNTTDVCMVLDATRMNPRTRALYDTAGGTV